MITELMDHQKKAVDKLSKLKVGALYMEMGTGKTRVALELAYMRVSQGKVDHIIWLCPCSVKRNLIEDIEKHVGVYSEDLITICGIQTLSSSVKENCKLLNLVKEKKCFIIVDESNMIKNSKAKRTENITRIAEKCKYKLILNGTPVTRNEADLYAQWFLLDWRILGYKSYYSFAANHIEYDKKTGRFRRTLNIDYLVQKIDPYCFQIKKDECLNLPDKSYSIRYFSLTKEQNENYNYVAHELMCDLIENNKDSAVYRLFSSLQLVVSGYYVETGKHISKRPFFKNYEENPRFKIFKEIVSDIYGNKCIVFCEYKYEINMLVDFLNNEYGSGCAVSFCGSDSIKKRESNVYDFKNDSLFLITNKDCGSYGLNLQFCSYAIFYSNDFDFGTRQQSEDRIHRIGQTNNVHIIDICAENTIDERILGCLYKKERMVDSFKSELKRATNKEQAIEYLNSRR